MESHDYWAGWRETASRDRLERLQDRKVVQQTRHVYRNSPFWRDHFDRNDVHPSDVSGSADLADIPFGRKADYREAQSSVPPYGGLLCRDASDIHEEGGFLWETSGTTGEPLRFLCSRREYERVDVEATCRILWTAGVRAGDVLAMCWPLTLWAVGHGIVDAASELGVTVLPLGSSYSSEFRAKKLARYRPDVLMTTPTYALRLATVAEEAGYDPESVGLGRAIVSGEPLPESTRNEITRRWGLDGGVYNYYGFSEALNCRSIECGEHDGIHVLEDLYLAQVVEPNGSEHVEEGEEGELVVTALEQRDIATGFHYRTGDIVRFTDSPCDCGRSTRRIEVVSRKDDMRVVRGVNVFPSAVESVVRDREELGDEFRLVLGQEGDLTDLSVVVEPRPSVAEADYESLRASVERRIEESLGGLSVPVEFVEYGELDRFDFKADRWVDRR